MNVNEIDINNSEEKFIELLAKAKDKHGVETNEDLRELLPTQKKNNTNGTIVLTDITGISLTSEGLITRNEFFANLEATSKEQYGEILLTRGEAERLSMSYKKTATGVNSAVPLTCMGNDCPFANNCIYVEMDKAPLGKPCKVEADLLNFHTTRFVNEFDVNVNDHSEIMLIQELSELIIMETRVTAVLAHPDNARLFGIRVSIAADGTPLEEEVEHWAWGTKEKIKNRRMKILESLNATRKAKAASRDGKVDVPEDGKTARLNKIINMMNDIKSESAVYEEQQD